jgi:hypothetical protein
VAVVLSASFYHPIVFWAQNAWELSSPIKILAVGASVAIVGLASMWAVARIGIDRRAAALGVATAILIFGGWETAGSVPVILKLALPVVVTWLANSLTRSRLKDVIAVMTVAVFGLAPLIQLVIAHVNQATSYPLIALESPGPALATGNIEDVVVVIVDAYPSLYVTGEWHGHDPTLLLDELTENDFVVPQAAWSQLTFTALSVPSILELQPVAQEGPLPPWGNQSSANRIIRGDNFVASALRSAGFGYTHIESGSDPLSCGKMVDHCVESPWIDETAWELLETTVAARWMEDNLGFYSVAGTLQAANSLTRIGSELIGNGTHDYIFAHLFLPHPPIAVDKDCQVLEGGRLPRPPGDVRSDDAYLSAFSQQLSCVDDLLMQISEIAGPETAILLTADHGTGFGGQVERDGRTWSDLDIAERLGILLAYRLPPACDPPLDVINIDVIRAIMACAVDVELPARNPAILLGADNPFLLDPERMAEIRSQVEAGTLRPSEG